MGLAPYSPEFFNNQVVKIFKRYMSGFKKIGFLIKNLKIIIFYFRKN